MDMLQSVIFSLEHLVTTYGFAWIGSHRPLSMLLSNMSHKITMSIDAFEIYATLATLEIMARQRQWRDTGRRNSDWHTGIEGNGIVLYYGNNFFGSYRRGICNFIRWRKVVALSRRACRS
jgi:hypothetical protein